MKTEQAALRQTVERQANEIADLRAERGRQGAELERAAATIGTLNAALEARTAAESTPMPGGDVHAVGALPGLLALVCAGAGRRGHDDGDAAGVAGVNADTLEALLWLSGAIVGAVLVGWLRHVFGRAIRLHHER